MVRIESRLDADIAAVWSALTDPDRLAHWYGEVDGELRPGGEYRARLHASGWQGKGRVKECEPPRRFLVVSRDPDEPHEDSTEVTLVEQRGLPLDLVWAYGAGLQIHVEDLAAHVAGQDRVDAEKRFDELEPSYKRLAAGLS